MADIQQAYHILFVAVQIVLAVAVLLCLIKTIIGPSIADRTVTVNMIGTQIISIIAILTVFLKEDYLADVAIIYALLSFIAVVALTKVYLGIYFKKRRKQQQDTAAQKEANGDDLGMD